MEHFAHFVAALFLTNGIPHFFQGISGNWFQSPFAKPPGIGESSPQVNVLWGSFNFVCGYFLMFHFGNFQWGKNTDTYLVIIGALLTALTLSWHFGRVRNPKQN